jgi:hypothetical protein
MSTYREEQSASQAMVRRYLERAPARTTRQLRQLCAEYRAFRQTVAHFQRLHLQAICNRTCFENQASACCNKDGIITFFADLVVNALFSPPDALQSLGESLKTERGDMKCIYLGPSGCRWHVKPIVCEMFLCDRALEGISAAGAPALREWRQLERQAKRFRWPDRPVLFDLIESRFLAAGLCSPLMYLHNSPGLVRIKRQAGLA